VSPREIFMNKKILVSELSAIRQIQSENLSFHGEADRARLARAFAEKSAALVELEIRAYRRRISRKK